MEMNLWRITTCVSWCFALTGPAAERAAGQDDWKPLDGYFSSHFIQLGWIRDLHHAATIAFSQRPCRNRTSDNLRSFEQHARFRTQNKKSTCWATCWAHIFLLKRPVLGFVRRSGVSGRWCSPCRQMSENFCSAGGKHSRFKQVSHSLPERKTWWCDEKLGNFRVCEPYFALRATKGHQPSPRLPLDGV